MLSSRLSRLERQLEAYDMPDETWPAADFSEIYGPSETGPPEIDPAE
jgi:hypothetical protein